MLQVSPQNPIESGLGSPLLSGGAPRTNQKSLRIPGLPDFTMNLHPLTADQAVSTYIYHFDCWEPFETLVFQRLIANFGMFVDLGANIGWYTVVAQLLMANGSEIHSFEPDPGNFVLLASNTNRASNAGVWLNQRAVADQAGHTELFRSSTNYGDHQLYSTSELRESVTVPMTTLDGYFADRELPPLLAKMDTQGSELRILRGGGSVFSPARPENVYMVEFWPCGIANAGDSVDGYIDALAELPQVPYAMLQEAGKIRLVSWDDLRRQSAPGGPLSPPTQQFIDLAMITPGTAAHRAVEDLILAD